MLIDISKVILDKAFYFAQILFCSWLHIVIQIEWATYHSDLCHWDILFPWVVILFPGRRIKKILFLVLWLKLSIALWLLLKKRRKKLYLATENSIDYINCKLSDCIVTDDVSRKLSEWVATDFSFFSSLKNFVVNVQPIFVGCKFFLFATFPVLSQISFSPCNHPRWPLPSELPLEPSSLLPSPLSLALLSSCR